MKTTFDVGNILYSILDNSVIKENISGNIYRNKKPLNSEKQDIVIVPLTNINGDIQNGAVFINIFCKNFEKGIIDIVGLEWITDAIISILEDYNQNSDAYFDFSVINQIIINDNVQKNMSYSSIKLNCYYEFDETIVERRFDDSFDDSFV